MRVVKCVLLCAAFVQASSAATVFGVVNFSTTFSSSSGAVWFAAGADGHNETTTFGATTGLNVTGSITALGSNFLSGTISANASQNITAGPNSSFSNAVSEAWSGVVRVTNSGSATTFSLNQTLLYNLQATGPDFAGQSMSAAIEFFNPATQEWEIRGITSFGISTNESNSTCDPACVGSSGYQIGADSFIDVRLHTRLVGSAGQSGGSVAVPEPETFALCGAFLIALAGMRFKQR